MSLADVYWLILTERASEVRRALELCLAQLCVEDEHGRPSPILVHCLHGKDRTGVLVALLLFICGVDEEEIQHDYTHLHPHPHLTRTLTLTLTRRSYTTTRARTSSAARRAGSG